MSLFIFIFFAFVGIMIVNLTKVRLDYQKQVPSLPDFTMQLVKVAHMRFFLSIRCESVIYSLKELCWPRVFSFSFSFLLIKTNTSSR